MKKLFCVSLVLMLLLTGLSACKKKEQSASATTAADSGSPADASVVTDEAAAPATLTTAAAAPQATQSAAPQTAENTGSATGETTSAAAQASAGSLSKEEILQLIARANQLTIGWLDLGFEAKKYFDGSDTVDIEIEGYSVPFTALSGAPYASVDALKTAVHETYTAAASEIFDGFIPTMYRMKDGKFYAQSSLGQGDASDGCRVKIKLLSQSESECRLQLDHVYDPALGEILDNYQAGDTVRSETMVLQKENGAWKFTSPVSLFGLYFNWFSLEWES